MGPGCGVEGAACGIAAIVGSSVWRSSTTTSGSVGDPQRGHVVLPGGNCKPQ
jgi:hypothetical protein